MIKRSVLLIMLMFVIFSATSMSLFMLIGGNMGASLGIFAASLINLVIMARGMKWLGKFDDQTVFYGARVPYLRRIK